MLIGHDSAVGEDQAIAVGACTLSLAKLASHLGECVHTVVVSCTTERGEAAEKSERCGVRKSQVVFRDFWNDRKAT